MENKIKKQTNCPNCGAPINHYYNYTCEYCGTFLHNTDEQIKKLDNANITIREIDIQRSPIHHAIMVTFLGVSTPRLQWYEEGTKEIIVSGDTLGVPVGYRVEVPLEEFIEWRSSSDVGPLLKYILDRLPPVFESQYFDIVDKLVEQLRLYRGGNR